MAFVPKLKQLLETLPPSMGKILACYPYGWRPGFGKLYRQRSAEIKAYSRMSYDQRKDFIFHKTRSIVEFAGENISFYKNLYKQEGFNSKNLKSFDDLCHIPIITKDMLKKCDLENRSSAKPGRYLVNTGGSSGSPLSFYILPSSISHEWAHMHRIWRKLDFTQTALKLALGGRNMNTQSVAYDALRHHYAVNIYHQDEEISKHLREVLKKHKVEYIHGYPSTLSDFAYYCQSQDQELADILAKQLKGGFLGSEYPAPHFRDRIESVFKIPTVSWYGHTERSVLAWEQDQKFHYVPFQTYGFTEAVEDSASGKVKLVATSYYNTASPFIRYDTGDEIAVTKTSNGILEEFKIEGGREGDYILDRNNKRISLTGLVFGRHHRIFEKARFVQIGQKKPGEAVFFVTIPKELIPLKEFPKWFDLSDIYMDFEFKQINEPILSQSGKALLNVKNSDAFIN